MLRIGDISLESRLLLAPIAGHCDLPFRLTARACGGVGLAFTDLLCPHGILKQNRQTRWLMATGPADQPLGMQLYGCDAELMAEAGRWAVDQGATIIDINMGCPVDKVTKTFAGSMMLQTPDHTLAVTRSLIQAVDVPVTCKLRLGYHLEQRTAPQLARRLVEAGAQAITIHGRTAEQRFRGQADLDGIAAVVAAVHEAGGGQVPCIGNGDVRTPFDARRMIEATGCDGVMIARAALGAPWIFRDTHHLLTDGRIGPELTLRQRLEVIRSHYRQMRRLRPARTAVNRLKQVLGGYSKHLGPCRTLKDQVRALTEDEADKFDRLVEAFLETSGPAADAVPVTWEQRQRMLGDSRRPATAA
ncbi:MAG: tRNA dihydrouridine synthase DusB [Phycisphaerae bacterium]|nr:tRNA dihydrouridine synthase DusB [Phycisphaerae bacterium]